MIGLPSNIPCLGVRSDMLMGPQSSSRISHADNPCFSEYQIKVTGMRFQIGSIIKVSEVPYHFGLVRDFQTLLYVLFLDRRMRGLFVLSTFPSMVENEISHVNTFPNFGMTICGFTVVRTHSSGFSRT